MVMTGVFVRPRATEFMPVEIQYSITFICATVTE